MATTTVPNPSTEAAAPDIPGLSDLLVGPYTFKNPKRAASAADNVREPLLEGIRGVGTLLWWASQHEEFGASRYSRAAIGEVGLLLELLGELAESTSIIGINAAATHAESANA